MSSNCKGRDCGEVPWKPYCHDGHEFNELWSKATIGDYFKDLVCKIELYVDAQNVLFCNFLTVLHVSKIFLNHSCAILYFFYLLGED